METNQIIELLIKIIGVTTGIVGTVLSIRLTIINNKEKNKFKITEPETDVTEKDSIVITGVGCKKGNMVILINMIIPGNCYIQKTAGNIVKNGCWSAISKLDIIKNERYIYALSIPETKYGQFRLEFDNQTNIQLSQLEDKLQRLKIKYELSMPKRMNRIIQQ
jgi:hypothetical protein